MNCRLTVAWLKIQMAKVKRIECDMFFQNSPHNAGIVIGSSLTAAIEEGRTISGKIYQAGSDNTVVRITNIANVYGKPYHNVLSISGQQITWNINNGRTRHGNLSEDILYPSFIGFGSMRAESSYKNIIITGVLSEKQMERLENQM
jgi:hypothetical protein